MAYFSNGTEGDLYYERWCERCIHQGGCSDPYCPIWELHLIWNYDACEPKTAVDVTKKAALEAFIPREGIGNGQCKMFVEGESDGK